MKAAIPIWAAFMDRAAHQQAEIAQPQGVTVVEVEAVTGRLWQAGCGPSVRARLSGTSRVNRAVDTSTDRNSCSFTKSRR